MASLIQNFFRKDFKDVDPYLRFNVDIIDILYVNETYSYYFADIPTIDALGDYIQNVLDKKYDKFHPLYAMMSYDTVNDPFGDIIGKVSL